MISRKWNRPRLFIALVAAEESRVFNQDMWPRDRVIVPASGTGFLEYFINAEGVLEAVPAVRA